MLPPEQEKLKTVADILRKRPKLTLQARGVYSKAVDGLAMRTNAVNSGLLTAQKIKLSADEQPGPVSVTDSNVQKAIRRLFVQASGEAAFKQAEAAAKKNAKQDKSAVAKTMLYETLYQQLIEREPLPTKVLQQLATDRARVIGEELIAKHQVSNARVQAPAPGENEGGDQEDTDSVAVKLELGTL